MRFFLSCRLQAAFLSALAGTNVAEAAARAAVTALSDIDYEADKNAGRDPNRQDIKDQSVFISSLSLPQANPIMTFCFPDTQRPMLHQLRKPLKTTQKELWLMQNL